ncbi:hypothetical protein ACWDD9_27530 [Kitasatospora sp. NPDC001119]|uniref:hypothetical protein n=1 Tax=unclassified Kitasatospora TaxID=2633591 RepID=UPI0036BC7F60
MKFREIELFRLDSEHVSGHSGIQRGFPVRRLPDRLECAAQPGHRVLHHFPRRGRTVIAPECGDYLVDTHHAIRAEQQNTEQGPLLQAANGHVGAVGEHFKRPQNVESHPYPLDSLRFRRKPFRRMCPMVHQIDPGPSVDRTSTSIYAIDGDPPAGIPRGKFAAADRPG